MQVLMLLVLAHLRHSHVQVVGEDMVAVVVVTMVAGTRRLLTASGVAMLRATAAVVDAAGAVVPTSMWMTSPPSPLWVRAMLLKLGHALSSAAARCKSSTAFQCDL